MDGTVQGAQPPTDKIEIKTKRQALETLPAEQVKAADADEFTSRLSGFQRGMMLRFLICLGILALVLSAKRDKKFIKQVVTAHNKYRTLHKVGNVVESKKMSKLAQTYAERVVKDGIFDAKVPKKAKKYGLNAHSKPGKVKGNVHIDDLYFQEGFYHATGLYGKEPSMAMLDVYGPFTQMVWKSTKKIGVGRVGGRAVIFYWPKGNIENQFVANVFDKDRP